MSLLYFMTKIAMKYILVAETGCSIFGLPLKIITNIDMCNLCTPFVWYQWNSSMPREKGLLIQFHSILSCTANFYTIAYILSARYYANLDSTIVLLFILSCQSLMPYHHLHIWKKIYHVTVFIFDVVIIKVSFVIVH